MSDNVEVICDDDDVFKGIDCLLFHRRHTLGGNSSLASASDHAPIVWRAVMPSSRRSTLVSGSKMEDVGGFRATIDGFMRPERSTSDTSRSRRNHGDKAAFTLHDVDAFSVQRAKVIRRVSEKRYGRFRNFLISYEHEMAMEIQARSDFSRERLDAWVNYIMSPTVLHCIVGKRGTQQELLDLLMVSAAISKYGESELMAKDKRGELDALPNIKLHTCDEYLQSCQQAERMPINSDSMAMEFVVRINDQLPEERRVGGVVLREILTHASTMKVAVNNNSQSDASFSLTKEEDRLTHIVARVQSNWFQDTMLKVNGRYLYDAIRQVLSNVNKLLWDGSKDKPELNRVCVERRDRLGAEVMQVDRRTASVRQARPRRPPPPPPLVKAVTRNASTTNDSFNEVLSVPSPPNASPKVGLRVYNRYSSLPVEEIHERESAIIAGMNRTYRRSSPLAATRITRPRGLPPKRPQSMEIDPLKSE